MSLADGGDGGTVPSAGTRALTLDAFVQQWNLEPMKPEFRLPVPKGNARQRAYPIGILWCTLKIATNASGTIVRATLEHEAKASYQVEKWSCAFAEQAMVAALLGDAAVARTVLSRLPPRDVGVDQRTETVGAMVVTRRNDNGNGTVTVATGPGAR